MRAWPVLARPAPRRAPLFPHREVRPRTPTRFRHGHRPHARPHPMPTSARSRPARLACTLPTASARTRRRPLPRIGSSCVSFSRGMGVPGQGWPGGGRAQGVTTNWRALHARRWSSPVSSTHRVRRGRSPMASRTIRTARATRRWCRAVASDWAGLPKAEPRPRRHGGFAAGNRPPSAPRCAGKAGNYGRGGELPAVGGAHSSPAPDPRRPRDNVLAAPGRPRGHQGDRERVARSGSRSYR